MRKLLGLNPEPIFVNVSLLIARIGIGALMLTHGWPKLMMLLGDDPIQFPGVMGLGATASLTLAVFAEVVCSILILLGLATRLASIPLLITMLVAVFHIHANDPFAMQEMGVLYLLAYAILLLMGSGKYSLDALIFGKKE